MRNAGASRRNQRGLTLIEVLVAVAILAIAIMISLMLYDAARKSFKKGENAAEQQQAVRIAFDKLNADLRMAGFNYNPDGDATRPDEQIENASDTAVVFRADFDAEDATASTTPETTLATGGAFNTVSTGNDEIVGYVLGKPDGSSSETLTFNADIASPRNGTVSAVSVSNVALTQSTPPYTLYRISLSNANGSVVKTPLVENVRSLLFRYYTQGDVQVAAPGGAETAAAKAARASIRRIEIDLTGLTRDPDLGWQDTTDTNPATRSYRKFQLRGNVAPRNLGMKGIRDIMADVTPPGKPGAPTLNPGHCGGFYITWPPNPSGDSVTSYRMNYGTVSGSPSGSRSTPSTSYYLGALSPSTTYYVTIQAVDAAGNLSVPSDERSATTTNTNTPKVPTDLVGTTDRLNSVRVAWSAVTENTANTTGDPESPMIRDLAGYRVYRGTDAGFTADADHRIADETSVTPVASPFFLDTAAVNCRAYQYKVTAVDSCGVESAVPSAAAGTAAGGAAPEAPTGVQAFIAGWSRNRVVWQPVTRNVEGATIAIDTYKVYRAIDVDGGDPPPTDRFSLIDTVVGATSYIDYPVPTHPTGYAAYYRVTALDDCPYESAMSDAAKPECSFVGTVAITSPVNGAIVVGVVPVTVQVMGGGGEAYTRVDVQYAHQSQGVRRTWYQESAGPSWTDSGWLADPPGYYTITATVTNDTGCTRSASITVQAGSIVDCCLHIVGAQDTIYCESPSSCKAPSYQFANDYCLTAVDVTSMSISWKDYVGGKKTSDEPTWQTVKFNGTPIANVGTWTTSYTAGSPPIGQAQKSGITGAPPIQYWADSLVNQAHQTNVIYSFDKDVKQGSEKNVFHIHQITFTLLDSLGNRSNITTTCTLPQLTAN